MSEDEVDDEFCFWRPVCLEPADVCQCSHYPEDDDDE